MDIAVGPNILVSQDAHLPHVELIVAANPRNGKNLLGGTMIMPPVGHVTASKTYASTDGGYTWSEASFQEQRSFGGADPQVAFSPHGTAYFSAQDFEKDESGSTKFGLRFYRSDDGGMSWSKPALLGYGYDHPQLVVDHTIGKYAGRVYVGVLYRHHRREHTVGVFRSDDDGRTFTGPVDVARGTTARGLNVTNLLVFRDGTLFVPYSDFEIDEYIVPRRTSAMAFVTSEDGGAKFSLPQSIHAQITDSAYLWFGDGLYTFPVYALDDQTETFRDRLYVAWSDSRLGKLRIFFSYSNDRGRTWSAPALIDPTVPGAALQYQPAISVSRDGVVAVTWFDTRASVGRLRYDQYFAASIDGGRTFLSPVRVSTKSSDLYGIGNVTPIAGPLWGQTRDSLRLWLGGAAGYARAGGDYMGLAADVDGIFHPFWADSRSGTFQIYTSAVRVAPPRVTSATHSQAPLHRAALIGVARDVTAKLEVVLDPLQYDSATKQVDVPLRLKNVSDVPIYAPMHLEVRSFRAEPDWYANLFGAFTPTLLNASNGKQRDGAMFNFGSALGDEGVLEPGAVSGTIVMKMRVVDPLKIPELNIRITGSVMVQP